MKKTYTLLAVLLTVCTALPAAAQKNLANKVTRAVVSAEKTHKQHQPDAMAKKAKPDTPVCAACGEKITDPYQHCQATGCTGLCSTATAPVTTTGTEEETPSVCPTCGHVYTIDEKYHGVEHVCPAQKKAEVCAACGEKIVESHQHCKATGYTGLCSAAKAKPTAAKEDGTTASCPRCHQPYTIDELYHGDKHTCPTAKTSNGPTGGEPECGVIFIESSEPAVQYGPNGGEPETNFFMVVAEDENASVGPTGGEPQGPMYQEVDEGALYRAEELLQADRDAHGGKPQHNLEYYYKQVTSVKK